MLRQTYSGWSASPSRVQYRSGERYTLLDFLPPIMQATSSKRFKTQHHTYALPDFAFGNEKKQVDQDCQFLINCWGFAYEVVYSMMTKTDRLTFTLSSPIVAYAVFFDDAKFQHVQTSRSNKALMGDATQRNKNLQPGDVVLIWHQNRGEEPYLDHIAVFIDEDLYFERAGTGDDVPFRLTDWKGLTTSWVPIAFNYDWRRVKATLSPAKEVFALNNPVTLRELSADLDLLVKEVQESFTVTPVYGRKNELSGQLYVWMKTFDPFVFDDLGRARLPQSAYNATGLEIALPKNIYK
eukprot:Colp12_sorted_trinity150504_noHs@20672